MRRHEGCRYGERRYEGARLRGVDLDDTGEIERPADLGGTDLRKTEGPDEKYPWLRAQKRLPRFGVPLVVLKVRIRALKRFVPLHSPIRGPRKFGPTFGQCVVELPWN
jgi:hypothetical protein